MSESSEQVSRRNARGPVECFRIDRTGQIIDTQYQLVSREETYAERDQGYYSNPFGFFQQFVRPDPYYYEQQRRDRGNYYYYNGRGYVPVPRESVRPPAQYYGQNRRDPRTQQQSREQYYGTSAAASRSKL